MSLNRKEVKRTPRFKSIHSTPPGGVYEYELDGEVIQARSRFEICSKVRALRASKGLKTVGDGFSHVMAWMCPRMPDGFCTEASTVKLLTAREVKANTQTLFGKPLVPADEAERRMEYCISECPMHTRRNFCSDCTGLPAWVKRGLGPGRGDLPADRAAGLCMVDEVMIMASASVDVPVPADREYPEGCWRRALQKKGEDTDGDK